MDLRDRFAAHVAGALSTSMADPAAIAARAYDIAEAMIAERARRIDAEEASLAAEPEVHGALLDEPMGYDEEIDDEPPYDPSWDVEARWAAEPMHSRASSRPPGEGRPGLARTVPLDELRDEERKERSA